MISAVTTDEVGHGGLQLVADRAWELVGADVATVALPSPDGESLTLSVVAGPASTDLRGQAFPIASSVSGEVIATGRPVVLEDAAHDEHASQPQVSAGVIGPAIWVPLRASGDVVGTLSVARRSGAEPFSEAELELVLLFAAQAGVILEIDRSRDDVRRLSILEDQERIARDLHDTVIQRLFATGLSLQGLTRLTSEPVSGRLASAIDDLDATIRQIRTVIFGLERPVGRELNGLRGRILDLAVEAARVLGFDPRVTFSGPIDTVVDVGTADEVVAVLREALSNVSRHAAAREVVIDAGTDGAAFTLTVTDDGVGLGDGGGASGHGVENMLARAARRGGTAEIGTRPEGGVRVRWSVPLGRV